MDSLKLWSVGEVGKHSVSLSIESGVWVSDRKANIRKFTVLYLSVYKELLLISCQIVIKSNPSCVVIQKSKPLTSVIVELEVEWRVVIAWGSEVDICSIRVCISFKPYTLRKVDSCLRIDQSSSSSDCDIFSLHLEIRVLIWSKYQSPSSIMSCSLGLKISPEYLELMPPLIMRNIRKLIPWSNPKFFLCKISGVVKVYPI